MELLDWRPPIVALPRAACHFILLDVRGVPERSWPESIRLQLMQLSGVSRLGFAYKVADQKARVWYWDESKLDWEHLLASAKANQPDEVALWPETVLRPPLQDGLHLLKLDIGFEALCIKEGSVYRTRWLPNLPDQGTWTSFVRDAGHPPTHPLPIPATAGRLPHPPNGWRLRSSLQSGTSRQVLIGTLLLALAGALVIVGLVYQLKLGMAIDTERLTIEKISSDNAKTIALQKEIDAQAMYLGLLQQARPKLIQLELMRELAKSGLLDAEGTTSLLEWEFRNNQLRLLFSVPADNFSLSKFLQQLDTLQMFKDIRLLPDTPPRTVGIQAILSTTAKSANDKVKKSTLPNSPERPRNAE